MKNLLIGLLLCYSYIYSQTVDDLIKKLPSLAGKEKISTLMDICYFSGSNNPQQALYYGNQGLNLAYKTKDSLLIASCQNDLSLAYYHNAKYDSCIYYAKRAYHTRLKHGKKIEAAASISKVAVAHFEKSELQEAIKYHQIALTLFEETKKSVESAKTKSNIGQIYDKMNMLPQAKRMFLEAADTCLYHKDFEGYLNAMGNLAIIYQKQDSLDKASNILVKLIPICKQHSNIEHLAIIYQNIGVIQKKLNNISNAILYFEKSGKISDSISDKNSTCINNINLGSCYTLLNKYDKAETLIKKGLEQAISISNRSWEGRGLLMMYELYKQKKDFKTASKYLEDYQQLEKKVFHDDLKKEVAQFEVKYNVLAKEQTILQQKNKLFQSELTVSQQNRQILLLISIFTSLVLIFLIAYQRQKVRRKETEVATLLKMQSEKQRIAKDLHDNLGAELTLISSLLDLRSSQNINVKDKKELSEIADKAREASALMRDTIWTTVNEELAVSQIGLRIKSFAEKLAKPIGMHINYSLTGKDILLGPDTTLNLYRVCQEIINNAVKHSAAKNFDIIINTDKAISIVLKDDGKGFDTNLLKEGYGLQNILTRAKIGGFSIQYVSEINKGTSYTINILPTMVI